MNNGQGTNEFKGTRLASVKSVCGERERWCVVEEKSQSSKESDAPGVAKKNDNSKNEVLKNENVKEPGLKE